MSYLKRRSIQVITREIGYQLTRLLRKVINKKEKKWKFIIALKKERLDKYGD